MTSYGYSWRWTLRHVSAFRTAWRTAAVGTMFPTQIMQPPPGHFGMPAAAAPMVPPHRQLDAGPPAWAPGQAQSSQPGWDDVNDPWLEASQQNHHRQQDHQRQGREAWQWYNHDQGQ